jgi:hypothetical protein
MHILKNYFICLLFLLILAPDTSIQCQWSAAGNPNYEEEYNLLLRDNVAREQAINALKQVNDNIRARNQVLRERLDTGIIEIYLFQQIASGLDKFALEYQETGEI